MPIFQALKGSSNANATISYCEKDSVIDQKSGSTVNKCVLKAGYNCDIADIRDDFAETRNRFSKENGRQAMHFVLSFNPKELPNTPDNQEKCLEIGLALAEKISKGHETGCFVHADQDHLHCHLVTNSVHYKTGSKYQMKKNADLVAFRSISDQVCKEHGIEPLEMYEGNRSEEKSAEKRIKERGGVPWKEEIKDAIRHAKSQAVDMDSYKELLAEKGVEMYERGEKTKGYIHVGQRDSGAKLYKLRDQNKALDNGLHLEDVERAFVVNKQQKKAPLHNTLQPGEKKRVQTAPGQPPSSTTLPSTDNFAETVKHAQDKKDDIKATSSQELKSAKTESDRAEIKRAEEIKLEQAELDKEMALQREHEIKAYYIQLKKLFPRSTHNQYQDSSKELSMFYGGTTKKLYKLTYLKDTQVISVLKRGTDGKYSEPIVEPTKDLNEVKKTVFDNIKPHERKHEQNRNRLMRSQREFER
ncbi:relaxase/mobilization nuclease domain-containing protein [Alkalihalobacillus sp. NPDC078783]